MRSDEIVKCARGEEEVKKRGKIAPQNKSQAVRLTRGRPFNSHIDLPTWPLLGFGPRRVLHGENFKKPTPTLSEPFGSITRDKVAFSLSSTSFGLFPRQPRVQQKQFQRFPTFHQPLSLSLIQNRVPITQHVFRVEKYKIFFFPTKEATKYIL